MNTHLLPTGKVLFWAYDDAEGFYIWDPNTKAVSDAASPELNLFCAGHSFLPDGRLIAEGGHIRNNIGLDSASIYDPFQDTWTRIANMKGGRWYPSSTTLANGDVLVTSGDNKKKVNRLPQVYQLSLETWRDLTNAQRSLPLYPRTFLAPNGHVFFATATSRYLDTSGSGAWIDVAERNVASRDNYGSACLYDDGKVLWTGGGDPPTETAEIIDLSSPSPAWQTTGSMAVARRQNNLTILPDGTVLATGGSSFPGFNESAGAVLYGELWDPATGQWTVMASESQYRGYHSTALLLPDGRVLSSGGDGEPNAQVFSPPYLFKGPRPLISSSPPAVNLAETFFVGTSDAASITAVTLLRLGALTHAQNWSQRIIRLNFTQAPGGLSVTAPSDPNIAPPGYYMVFIVNADGVPSVAPMLRLDAVTQPCAPTHVSASAVLTSTVGVGGGYKKGKAQVTIVNDCGGAAEGALVTGTFTGDIEQTVTAQTDGSGIATIDSTATARGKVKITFCVDGVVVSLVYDASANNETCDSN